MTYQSYACLISKILYQCCMKSKKNIKNNEKTVVISVGQLTQKGIEIFGKIMKTAEDAKRSKLTIKLEKE